MDLGLFDHIDRNRRRSVILIALSVLFLVALGAVLARASGVTPWGGMAAAVVIGIILSLVAWFEGSSIVLATAGAREVSREEDRELVNVVEEMAIASGLPKPRVYLIETDAMNAFAAGIRPEESVVAVTRGLRQKLTREELQGVVAHEMAHIGNYDTRVMILMAVMVGSVAILADWYLRSMRFRRFGGGRRGGGKGEGVIVLIAVLCAVLAPLFATMIQFAVSRQREYLADATGAAMTRNPGALADALEKLGGSGIRLDTANRGTQHLYIVNPFRLHQDLNSPFASHPPIEERIRRLRALAGGKTARPA
ncbi:MAG TPA: M48 family metallopeptidase [Planctomycetota bacterium]|nr:M48 family metallopeptidase [Planctomycetota bacterium]